MFKKTLTPALLLVIALSPLAPFGMDLARLENRTDLAIQTFGGSGAGVIVAILDRGIDWRNQDFRNDDGTTRIKYIFDLTDNSGATAPGNTYGVGTIFTEAQINAALTGGPNLATRDAVGHGTTTAGIAASDGSNLPGRKYRGIAPGASLIIVKFTTEGAPAHDGQPAENSFYNPSLFPAALNFVRDKAAQLGMPVVMLGNFGSINGPADGSGQFARGIDAMVGPGKPGIAFVMGPGDDGGRANHAGGTVAQGGTASIQIQKNVAGPLTFDLWYPGSDRFNVSIQTPGGTFGTFTAPAAANGSDFVANPQFNYYHLAGNSVFYGAQNGKREIFIQLTGPVGTYSVNLTGANVTEGGRFHATINPSNLHTDNRFTSFVEPGYSIWEGATALNNISPTNYVLRTDWTDVDGQPRSITGEGAIGDLWTGASSGPTFDGRLGVDLAAPGEHVFATLAPLSNYGRFRHNMIQDGNGLYVRANAVSAAAPQVTGLVALMLEKNPTLDAFQIRSILRRTARKDTFTGPAATPRWGHGKMDAYAAIEAVINGRNGYSIAGRVTTPTGQPLRNAAVILTDDTGHRRVAFTSSFGTYQFTGVPTDRTYTIAGFSRRFRFTPLQGQIIANITGADLTAQE